MGMFLLSKANGAFIFLLSAAFIILGWGMIFPTKSQTILKVVPISEKYDSYTVMERLNRIDLVFFCRKKYLNSSEKDI